MKNTLRFYIKRGKFLILSTFLFLSTSIFQTASAQLVLSFSKALSSRCNQINSHMAKKLLVHFMQAENVEAGVCDPASVDIILSLCGNAFTCKDASAIYFVLKQKGKGNVIGN